jgi:protocatechuate 3,4-dioxygenase beta subunit
MTGEAAAGRTSPADITEAVRRSFAGCSDERLRELIEGAVACLHDFVIGASLTEEEWAAGIEFLTAVGQMCSPTRQEFILLSDTLGVSMLVDAVSHDSRSGATESTVLGPFYLAGSTNRRLGEAIMTGDSGPPVVVRGTVTDTSGTAIAGAMLDVWQNSENMLYAVQDPSQEPDNGRGRFRTDDRGEFWFLTVRPVDYPIPHDGPVGRMLEATGRHPWRPAHIHVICTAPGHRSVTTHVFDAASNYLDSDAVFGVKDSLVREFVLRSRDHPDTPHGVTDEWYDVDCSIALEPE